MRSLADRLPVARTLLLGSTLLLAACGGGDGDRGTSSVPPPAPSAASAGSPEATSPVAASTAKLAAALLDSRLRESTLPPRYVDLGPHADVPGERARKIGAVAKVTFDVQVATTNHVDKVSYTIYPSVEQAREAFAVLGERPADRKVNTFEPVVPTGIDAPVWGETTSEMYEGKQFVRNSTAALTGYVIVLAQTSIVAEAPQPSAQQAAVQLLRAGVIHLQDILNGIGWPSGGTMAPATSPLPSPSAVAAAGSAATASPSPTRPR
jgi:hypothetical protein